MSMIVGIVLFVSAMVLAQKYVYRKYWAKHLELKMSFSAREAFEGDRLYLTEELSNAKPLPLPYVTAGFQLSRNLLFPGQETAAISDDYYQSDMFSVGMYQRITRRLEVVCWRRGHYRIKSMSLSSSNLMLDDLLVRHLDCPAELTVLPRLIEGPEVEVLWRRLYGDVQVRRFVNPDPFAFRGIREYLPWDPMRSVNFGATAKTGMLMVNVNDATASQHIVLLLNLESYADWGGEDVYEEGIRLAASFSARFLEQGLSVELYSNGRDLAGGGALHVRGGSGKGHLQGILHSLARLDLSLEREPMEPLLEGLRRDDSAYVLISSCAAAGVAQAFGRMRDRGLPARWIIPAYRETRLQVEESDWITRWEVKPYDTRPGSYQAAVG